MGGMILFHSPLSPFVRKVMVLLLASRIESRCKA